MKTLKEFLQEQAEPLWQRATAKQERAQARLTSVERLIDQMMNWLKDVDPEGRLLRFQKLPLPQDEGGNRFLVPSPFHRLVISVGDRRVFITPLLGDVVAPGVRGSKDREVRGRIDITDGTYSFILYCFIEPSGEESWTILDDQTFEAKPFTREAFEAALVSLLG